jgi:hypothetical protein
MTANKNIIETKLYKMDGENIWDVEPDRVEWFDVDTGLPCLVIRIPDQFHLCGYVGIPEEHNKYLISNLQYDVHGGVTYTSHGNHIIYHNRAKNVWWVGFDCAHACDLVPTMAKMLKINLFDTLQEYRDISYVMMECKNLARQIYEDK